MIDEAKFPHWRIGDRLAALREVNGLSKKEWADRLGLAYTRYINWESGHRRPLPDEAEVFCDRFGVTLDWIYRGIDAQLPHSLAISLSEKLRDKAQSTSSEMPD